jgi:archaellum biogenesis protein FlaJ (TadC family)
MNITLPIKQIAGWVLGALVVSLVIYIIAPLLVVLNIVGVWVLVLTQVIPAVIQEDKVSKDKENYSDFVRANAEYINNVEQGYEG